jgi:pSer/pThr/pTyr-binding forkhead associated (FHA) protein
LKEQITKRKKMATLCLINDDGSVVQQWEVGEKAMTIGRGTAVDVKIEDAGLSRRHFMIARHGGGFLLKDLSSRNGTWVDGERVMATYLGQGTPILAGCTHFRFSEQPIPADTIFKPETGPHGTAVIPPSLAMAER